MSYETWLILVAFTSGIPIGILFGYLLPFFIIRAMVRFFATKLDELLEKHDALAKTLDRIEDRLARIEGRIAVPDASERVRATDRTREEQLYIKNRAKLS